MDYARQAKQQALEQEQHAQMIKFERGLQELERLGAKRINDMREVIQSFEMDVIKSVVFDLESAQQRFQTADRQLKRL